MIRAFTKCCTLLLAAFLESCGSSSSESRRRCAFGDDVHVANLGSAPFAPRALNHDLGIAWWHDQGTVYFLGENSIITELPTDCGDAIDVVGHGSEVIIVCAKKTAHDELVPSEQWSIERARWDGRALHTEASVVTTDAVSSLVAENDRNGLHIVWQQGPLGDSEVWRIRPSANDAEEVMERLSDSNFDSSSPNAFLHEGEVHSVWQETWTENGFPYAAIRIAPPTGSPKRVALAYVRNASPRVLSLSNDSSLLVYRDFRRPMHKPSVVARRLGPSFQETEREIVLGRADRDSELAMIRCGATIAIAAERSWKTDSIVGIHLLSPSLRKLRSETQIYEWQQNFEGVALICADSSRNDDAIDVLYGRLSGGQVELRTMGLHCRQ